MTLTDSLGPLISPRSNEKRGFRYKRSLRRRTLQSLRSSLYSTMVKTILLLLAALSATTVLAQQGCDPDYIDAGNSDCCRNTHGQLDDNSAQYPCDDMIEDNSVDWKVGSSYTLECAHGDSSSLTNQCQWETAKGTCTYNPVGGMCSKCAFRGIYIGWVTWPIY